MAYKEILYTIDGSIATITLNRPESLNAWTRTMEKEIHSVMTEASGDDKVRCIILTGAGRGFCAGADMNSLDDLQQSSTSGNAGSDSVRAVNNAIQGGLHLPSDFGMRYTYFPTVPKPIIAAINGPAAGLGLIMSLYCDLRFASDTAMFTTAFSRRGLIAEHGISWMLPKLIGHANALDLILSARKVTSQEALDMGLINRIFTATKFIDEVKAFAEEISTMVSPRSIRIMKRQVYSALLQPLEQAVLVANSEMPASFDSNDFKEGVAHFLERRLPNFSGS